MLDLTQKISFTNKLISPFFSMYPPSQWTFPLFQEYSRSNSTRAITAATIITRYGRSLNQINRTTSDDDLKKYIESLVKTSDANVRLNLIEYIVLEITNFTL